MSLMAEVKLWGRTIAAVSWVENAAVGTFEYDASFLRSGIELSPLNMPLSPKLYRFDALSRESFHGLPGLLSDSLPDRFGNSLINAWLASQGRLPESFNPVERLCYTGSRGIGALEFYPSIGKTEKKSRPVEVDRLVDLASEVLSNADDFLLNLDKAEAGQGFEDILRVGTSAGGARAKAVIAWNPKTNEIRSGQVKADEGFEYWLIKFDGVQENKDKELADPVGYGAIEYAYSKMLKDAGISMNPCLLLEENGRRHFMTKRFDRSDKGEKLHMQSLAALAHFDFNLAGAYGYEQTFLVMKKMGLSMDDTEELFRRMAFNIIGRNQDDHVKNTAFLMDKTGRWSLSPVYDVTYNFQPTGRWTSVHQMSMNGKRDAFTLEDFKDCAKTFGMKRGRAKSILNEVQKVVRNWCDYAEEAKVISSQRDKIQKTLRLDIVS